MDDLRGTHLDAHPKRRIAWGGRSQGLILAATLAAGAFLRLYALPASTLWFDEACSWEIIGRPWAQMVRTTAADVHPPLYFLALKAWVSACGDSVVAMRALSVLLDVIGLYVTYRFVTALYARSRGRGEGEAIGLLTAAILALSIFRIVQAREVRMYPLGGLLVVLSSWALWQALQPEGRRLGPWAAYATSTIALIYTHNYGLFTVAAQVAFVLIASVRESRPAGRLTAACALLAFGSILAAYSPWLPTLLDQRSRVTQAYWIPPLDLDHVIASVEQTLVGDDDPFPKPFLGGVGLIVVAAVLTSLLIGGSAADLYVFLLSVVPLSLALGVSLAQGRNVVLGKYLAFSFPFWAAALARLVTRIPPGAGRVAIIAFLLGDMAVQDVSWWIDRSPDRRHGVRSAIETVAGECQPGDVVLTLDPGVHLAARYYLRDRPRCPRPLCLTEGATLKPNQGNAVFPANDYVFLADVEKRTTSRAWFLSSSLSTHRTHLVVPGSTLVRSEARPDSAPQYDMAYLRLFTVDGVGGRPK